MSGAGPKTKDAKADTSQAKAVAKAVSTRQLETVGVVRSDKVRAVSTRGKVGAAYAVVGKNWTCPQCGFSNFPSRNKCQQCRCKKPDKVKAEEGSAYDPSHTWQEAFDPRSKQIYYFNRTSGVTQWSRPAEMGPAPHATGWFGRGAAGNPLQAKYDAQDAEWRKRPARNQQPDLDPRRMQSANMSDFNVWYGRHSTNGHRGNREPAEARCVLATDAGRTRADKAGGAKYFCVHFAKGMCAYGSKCTYYHRIPTAEFDASLDLMHDVFGRERHASHRDDMGGTGSFQSDSRTLYVGSLKSGIKNMKKLLTKHFEEWGELENINYIPRINAAFVRYRLRSSAEFAREAMGNQSLGNGEIMNVRWAHDDPNPVAKRAAERSNADAIIAAMRAKHVNMQAAGFDYPASYQMPAMKKPRLGEHSTVAYPDTDTQYGGAAGGAGAGAGAGAASAAGAIVSRGVEGGAAMARSAAVAATQGAPGAKSYNVDVAKQWANYYKQYAEWSHKAMAAMQAHQAAARAATVAGGTAAAAPTAAPTARAATGAALVAGYDSDDDGDRKPAQKRKRDQ